MIQNSYIYNGRMVIKQKKKQKMNDVRKPLIDNFKQ